jgi:hypothetical protein
MFVWCNGMVFGWFKVGLNAFFHVKVGNLDLKFIDISLLLRL